MNLENFSWEEVMSSQKSLSVKLPSELGIYGDIPVERVESGKVVKATYVGLEDKKYIFESMGLKDFIYVDYKPSESRFLKSLEPGEKTDVMITRVVDKMEFLIEGSVSSLYESKAMDNFNSLTDDQVVDIYVKSINGAGFDLDILHEGLTIPGFMPNTLAGVNKLVQPERLVGETLKGMIESFSENEGTYIISRRRYLESLIPNEMSKLERGVIYTGWVTGTAPFGIFVEFNDCLTGLVHTMNMNPEWVERIEEIKPGFEIDFYVKDVVKNKIILTQILRESLWDSIEPGQVYSATVKSVKPFGVLMSLDDDTIGLIYQNEVEKHELVVSPGDEINVKVLNVDQNNRKIFLSPRK